jgi:prolipoprotein diacylglyceryltransferase
MKQTIIVLTIETDKVPPKELISGIERHAYGILISKGISVGACMAAAKTTDKPE